MSFTREDLLLRKERLLITLAEAETKYKTLLGSKSIAEVSTGNDVLFLQEQIREIDSTLAAEPFEESIPVPRREELPDSPTVLVDGIPPRNGVPANARIMRRSDGISYYVDSQGRIISRV